MTEYQINQLTNNDLVDTVPEISGNNVVWRANDGNDDEIFFYDGETTIQLTNNNLFDFAPVISENRIAWTGSRLDITDIGTGGVSDGSVFFYDGNETIKLDDVSGVSSSAISGNNVVWGDTVSSEVFFYNGSNTIKLGDSVNPIFFADSISGNNVVWTGDSNNLEVFLYNGSTTTQITNNDLGESIPLVSGNNIAWTGNLDSADLNSAEIFFYNGETTTQLTDDTFIDLLISISSNNVVWIGNDDDGNDNEIFLYDGSTTIQLTDNEVEDLDPQVSGNNIVWEANDGNDSEIFLYDGTNTIQITNNQIDDLNPQISENNNLVWEADDEIFLATPIAETTPTPEPTTIELFRFRNTTFDSGTYVFVGEEEKNAILEDEDLSQTFSLDGQQDDGTVSPAFVASTTPGDDLAPFYRLKSLDVPGTFLLVGTTEYDAIFAEDSEQQDKWEQEGLDAEGEDIPEFYLYEGSAEQGTAFNRFQNNQNGTFLYAGAEETEAIESDPNLSSLFTNQGVAFKSLE
jgi:hypothetical protein